MTIAARLLRSVTDKALEAERYKKVVYIQVGRPNELEWNAHSKITL